MSCHHESEYANVPPFNLGGQQWIMVRYENQKTQSCLTIRPLAPNNYRLGLLALLGPKARTQVAVQTPNRAL
jgi:hypothetical protein